MNVKELRIGNYIESPRGIEEIKYAESLEEIEDSPDKFKGIPITQEWLLKLGFDRVDNYTLELYLCGGLVNLHANHDNEYADVTAWYQAHGDCADYYFRMVEFVHQLQNLYHALTGEELTIKE